MHSKKAEASPRAKSHSLLIQELREFEGGRGATAYYSKGHHGTDAFVQAVDDYLGGHEGDMIAHAMLDEGKVKHEWWRCIPVNVSGEWQTLIGPGKPGTRGSFPVTMVDA